MTEAKPHDARTVPIPTEHVRLLADLVHEIGIATACAEAGLSRSAGLGVIATGRGMPGTAALLREFAARRAAA